MRFILGGDDCAEFSAPGLRKHSRVVTLPGVSLSVVGTEFRLHWISGLTDSVNVQFTSQNRTKWDDVPVWHGPGRCWPTVQYLFGNRNKMAVKILLSVTSPKGTRAGTTSVHVDYGPREVLIDLTGGGRFDAYLKVQTFQTFGSVSRIRQAVFPRLPGEDNGAADDVASTSAGADNAVVTTTYDPPNGFQTTSAGRVRVTAVNRDDNRTVLRGISPTRRTAKSVH